MSENELEHGKYILLINITQASKQKADGSLETMHVFLCQSASLYESL